MLRGKRNVAWLLVALLFFQGVGGWLIPAQPVSAAIDPTLQSSGIAAGTYHTLFLMSDGTVKSSGQDLGTGALGLGFTTNTYTTPTSISGLTNVKQVASFGQSSYALLKDGTVKAWGLNNNGQLGLGNTTDVYTPTAIPGLTNVKQIAPGNSFVIALLNDGTLKGWGLNSYGELTSLSNTSSPTAISGLSNVKQISAGENFVLALLTDGTVKSWGRNSEGQLGLGNTTDQNSPTSVSGLSNVIQVTAGALHGLALLADGSAKSWGSNANGQLGNGGTTSASSPGSVSGIANARYLSAGKNSSMAVLKDDSVMAWGLNNNGQLGLNDIIDRTTPTAVNILSAFQAANVYVNGSSNNTFVIGKNGRIYGSGSNGYGELGLGNTTNVNVFTNVANLTAPISMIDMQLSITEGSGVFTGPISNFSFLLIHGEVKAWGKNDVGQLGLGHTTNQLKPVIVPGLTGVKQISTGRRHTVALMEDGTVKAWGRNWGGQLGLGHNNDQSTPNTIPGLTGVKQVAAGGFHTLLLMEDGTVKSMGENDDGQLGLGNTTYANTPTTIPGLTGVKQISAGYYYSIALMEDGSVKTWGDNWIGQLGLGNTTDQYSPTTVPGLTNVIQVAAGAESAYALLSDGTVKSWGTNGTGELGLGHNNNVNSPAVISNLSGVKQITAGFNHAFVLLEDGSWKGWGYNFYGQLGLGHTNNKWEPTAMPNMIGAKQIVAGGDHTLILFDDGTVRSSGNNSDGQLGLGNTTAQYSPTTVPTVTAIIQIVSGEDFTLVLMEDGTVKAWGRNYEGQLGLGHWDNVDKPTTIPGLSGVKQLATGKRHSLALLHDGTVKAWGYNWNGQLGLGSNSDKSSPQVISGLNGVKQLEAGFYHTVALMEDGSVKAWGYNSAGQLGQGNTTDLWTPAVVTGLSDVLQVVAGTEHTMALMSDGTVKSWGLNSSGQLGQGNTTDLTIPTTITGLANVKSIETYSRHVMALTEDGSVKVWGYNNNGELGLGDTTDRNTPTVLSNLSGIKQLSTGYYHSFVLLNDGTVKVWGGNEYGQLGIGSTTNQSTPVVVQGLQDVDQLASGSYHSFALLNNGILKAWGKNQYNQLAVEGDRRSPTNVDYFALNSITVSATFSGAFDSSASAKLYLDNETDPREQISVTLNDGTGSARFQPFAQFSLSKGNHTARVVVTTPYQVLEKTANFTVAEGSFTYPLEIDPQSTTITVRASGTETLSELAAAPYRITVGSQTSGWLSPVATLNSTVSASALDFSGAGVKKMLQLSNGWWVLAGYTGNTSSGIQFMVSKDRGATWSQLCTLSDASIESAPAIISTGTKIIGIARVGATSVKAFNFDAASQSNVNIYSTLTNVDTNQTDISGNMAIAIDSGNQVHAAWISKNATLPNSFNIRYAKSTDSGWTWQTVQQITSVNTAGYSLLNPVIATVNNQPIIWSEFTQGSNYLINQYAWNGSVWNASTPVAASSYSQQDVNVLVDGGLIHMVWSGADSTENAARNIRYMKSVDGGANWSTAVKLTTGNTYNQNTPVMTKDSQNKLYVVYSGIDASISTSSNNLRLVSSVDGGSIWGAPVTLTNMTAGSAEQPIVLQENKLAYASDDPVVVYKNTQSASMVIRGTIESGAYYTASGLNPNTKYTVKFEVKDSSGIIRTTTRSVYTLAAVPSVSVTQSNGQPALLSVSDTNPSTTGYQIYSDGKYWSSEGKWVNQPVNLKLTDKQVTLSGIDVKKSYAIKVLAVNEDGKATNWSNIVNVGPPVIPPAAPKNLKAQAASDRITLSWSPVIEATGYELEIDGQATPTVVGTNLNYKHTNLLPNTLHQYRVRAVKGGTAGAWSSPISVRTLVQSPNTPGQIVASATARTVTLTWDDVQYAYAFEVEWDGQIFSVGRQTTSFTKTELAVGSRHTYRLRAVNSGGRSPWSPLQVVVTTTNAPGVPAVLVARIGDKSVELWWPALDDATYYEVEADGVVVNMEGSNTASFTGLAPNSAHVYRVRAFNEVGVSSWSSNVNVTTWLLATPIVDDEQISDTSVSLEWLAVPDATGYEVEVDSVVQSASTTQFTDSGLSAESEHTYRIRAINASGQSSWTEPLVYKTLPLKPVVPGNISATAGKNQIYLAWGAVSGAAGYDVEIDGKVVIDNFTQTTYVDILLDPFTLHQYRIRARTDAVEGDWSALIALRTLPEVPTAPANIAVNSNGNIVTLSWMADPSASKYEVEVNGQVVNVGANNEFKHRRVAAGSEQKYRIRTTNVSGVGPWSGLIINNTVTAKLTKAETVDIGLAGVDVLDFTKYTLNVAYDPNAIDITDLSTLTGEKELTAGPIEGTDITIVEFKPGLIVFTTNKAISPDESWTGVINSIQMKAKVSGGSSITYSVIEKPEI